AARANPLRHRGSFVPRAGGARHRSSGRELRGPGGAARDPAALLSLGRRARDPRPDRGAATTSGTLSPGGVLFSPTAGAAPARRASRPGTGTASRKDEG